MGPELLRWRRRSRFLSQQAMPKATTPRRTEPRRMERELELMEWKDAKLTDPFCRCLTVFRRYFFLFELKRL
ncbi:Os03g0192550 [Oryza sativa Japonica Group]|uniref:Os03g0192550 protein n=1 Tax=Oryza sativa subsp. japonica TaxID=39947 RepID=A0A0P0VU20_ORYSJ|nr:hypothetical protein EE612_015823 [Oryza sativa]BAS82732.1 Os03g0192550 [Oryza sativa Japonica Group]